MTLKRAKGDVAKAHRHIPKKRVTRVLQECLIVIQGTFRYDLFDTKKKCFKRVLVRAGEASGTLGGGCTPCQGRADANATRRDSAKMAGLASARAIPKGGI